MCTFIIYSECFFFLTLITRNIYLLFVFTHDFFKQNPRRRKKIPFRFAIHNRSSKIVGWLVGARDGKILELRIKSGINNKSAINPVSFVQIQELVL